MVYSAVSFVFCETHRKIIFVTSACGHVVVDEEERRRSSVKKQSISTLLHCSHCFCFIDSYFSFFSKVFVA